MRAMGFYPLTHASGNFKGRLPSREPTLNHQHKKLSSQTQTLETMAENRSLQHGKDHHTLEWTA